MSAPKLSLEQLTKRRFKLRDVFNKVGSKVSPFYSPSLAIRSPPKPRDVSIAALLAAQAHLGHATSLWNPMNQPFIYGIRNGIHIISLDKTLVFLRRAINVIQEVARTKGIILFVGTKPGQKLSVMAAAKRCNGYFIFNRWVPGLLTNAKTVQPTLGGSLKTVDQDGKEVRAPTPSFLYPDLIVILNPLENINVCKEAQRVSVPTIGIVDTNVDPRLVTYPIPANDDSLRCSDLIVGLLSQAACEGMD
ncbi:mitochondrial 37S ribosomal protein MRP4 [Schizosaccharomyces japonicus yFS275]|uniref:Ribosomal protein subunit S2 n=1 Tax=Schizosaccharomyces japonicus (strain yFS275 / FY16936) TaxID=402676 RepID=B6K4M2_SCHJY|nr:mitochondrial 37S ribosomal protein MRP4 [Schizosaccharomyces japonicus yFS275]EEB08429.1 ribosomal protein subunit S2 [Schizosaccharomyces japonicus yFS275]